MKRWLAALLVCTFLPLCARAELLTIDEMTDTAQDLAEFTIAGMPAQEYIDAATMAENWTAIVSAHEPQELDVDLLRAYTWEELEMLMKAMSSHDGVSVDVIGTSARGRRMYSVRVGTGERLILLTGGVHAKETAGTMYILKQLCGLINALSEGDERTTQLLSQFSIVAVPCVNPDGRAVLEEEEGIDWRANDAGVDLGLNFPCANAGQAGADSSTTYHATEPGPSDYAGKYLGSEAETKVLIGWLEEYIADACAFIDYEQYGRYLRGAGEYLSADCQQVSDLLCQNIAEYLTREDANYSFLEREEELRGWSGGSIADFAAELAEGLVFSSKYGRLGLNEGEGAKPLCFFGDLDECAGSYAPRTLTPLACVTIDISTRGGTGYYENARRNHQKEYDNCGYDGLLTFIMEYLEW